METHEFSRLYKGLNPQQRLAVDSIEGPVMVVAGPGTGKTQILTLRIANILLKTQVNPENILALTFSESASFEMRQRLMQIIGTASFRVEIATFHSFSNAIIKDYPDEFQRLLSSENITEVEQIAIIEKILELTRLKILRPYGDPLYYLKDILSSINDLKKEGVNPEKLDKSIKVWEKEFASVEDLYHEKGAYKGQIKGKYLDEQKEIEKIKELSVIYVEYQKVLEKEKKYDFNDMLLEVIRALEKNKSLLLRLQEKFQYILIDEHQDTNASQNRLVELISAFYEVPNLFVVGDEKQAIYRFQGASLENFLFFKKIYPLARLINLETNYRSHQTILDASYSLIEKNISANILPQTKLTTDVEKKTIPIKMASLSSYDLEYEYVGIEIQQLIKKGVNLSEIAVLARWNMDLYPLSKVLNRLGIKFTISSDQNILSDIQIKKLINIFNCIVDQFNEEKLIKVMHLDFLQIDPFDVYKIISFAKKQKRDLIGVLMNLQRNDLTRMELESPEALLNFLKLYKGWITLSTNIPFDDFFIKVINESGFKEYILKLGGRYQILNKLTALFDEIKLRLSKNVQFSTADFTNLLQTVERNNLSIRSKVERDLEDGVRLITVHKSKGAEFEFVFIINLFDGRWGSGRRRAKKIKIPWRFLGESIKSFVEFEAIEDERRLLFVALTRAKQEIILTYAKESLEGKEQLPSQFLEEINKDLIEKVDTSTFEKRFEKSEIFANIPSKEISAKNKKYLQNLFAEKGLSVTGLENFLQCPWKYFFRNLISLPDAKNKYLIFGTAIHHCLDAFIKGRRKSLTENFLIEKFIESLNKEALTLQDRAELEEKGHQVLINYYKQEIPRWSADIQSEMNIRGVQFNKNVVLNGRIDMIEELGNGFVRVYDFKTGKPKKRAEIDGSKIDEDYNYLRQLTFYKILLNRYKDGLLKMKEGIIDFVEADTKGVLHKEVFVIGDTEVKDLEKIISSVAEQIMNLSFWDLKCGDKDCEYCYLRDLAFG